MPVKTIACFIFITVLFNANAALAASENVLSLRANLSQDSKTARAQIVDFLSNNRLNEEDKLEVLLINAELTASDGYMQEYQQLALDGIKRAQAINHLSLIAKFNLRLADSYSQMSRWLEAKTLYLQTINSLKKSDNRLLFASANMMFGLSCFYNKEYELALSHLTQAYELFLTEDPVQVPTALHNIALVYDVTNDHVKALKYFKQSLEYYDEEKEALKASITYYNIGLVSIKIDDLNQAEFYLNKSLKIAKEFNMLQVVAFSLGQLSALEYKRNNFPQSKLYAEESLLLAEQLKNDRLRSRSLYQLIETQIKLKEFSQAKRSFAILREFSSNDTYQEKIKLLKLKSELHIQQNEFKDAVKDYQEIIVIIENMMIENDKKSMLEIRSKFDNRLQEQENEILRQRNQLQELSLSEQKKLSLLYIIGYGGLFITIIFLLLFAYREKRVRKKFAQLALTDELTGVANRRAITQRATEEFDRFKRYQQDCLICLLDLDFFKQVNDQFGHDTGDLVLKDFANCVTQAIREMDWFGRVGGEEWVLVLPQVIPTQVDIVFQRIAELCLHIKVPEGCRPITFSMGVSQPQEHDQNVDEVLKRADLALYQAKSNGRNCLHFLAG